MKIRNFLAMFMVVISACFSFGAVVDASDSEKSAEGEMQKALGSAESLDSSTSKYIRELRATVGYPILKPLIESLKYDSETGIRESIPAISGAAERIANDIIANYKLDSIELDSEKHFITKAVFRADSRPPIIFSCKYSNLQYEFNTEFGDCIKTVYAPLCTDVIAKAVSPTSDFKTICWSSMDRANIERVNKIYGDNPTGVGKLFHQNMFQIAVRSSFVTVCDKIRASSENTVFKLDARCLYNVNAAIEKGSDVCFSRVKFIKRKFDLWLLAEIGERLYNMLADWRATPYFAHASLGDTVSFFAECLAWHMCDQIKNQYLDGKFSVQ